MHLLNSVNMDQDQFQLGKTKVFIKAPESVRKKWSIRCKPALVLWVLVFRLFVFWLFPLRSFSCWRR